MSLIKFLMLPRSTVAIGSRSNAGETGDATACMPKADCESEAYKTCAADYVAAKCPDTPPAEWMTKCMMYMSCGEPAGCGDDAGDDAADTGGNSGAATGGDAAGTGGDAAGAGGASTGNSDEDSAPAPTAGETDDENVSGAPVSRQLHQIKCS